MSGWVARRRARRERDQRAWRLPAFMDRPLIRAIVVEREHGKLTDDEFVDELRRYLRLEQRER